MLGEVINLVKEKFLWVIFWFEFGFMVLVESDWVKVYFYWLIINF